MADDAPQSTVDFWTVLEDAKVTVEQWPSWQQQYDADIFSIDKEEVTCERSKL